jgi:hypothetical protein
MRRKLRVGVRGPVLEAIVSDPATEYQRRVGEALAFEAARYERVLAETSDPLSEKTKHMWAEHLIYGGRVDEYERRFMNV